VVNGAPGEEVEIARGALRDRRGNRNANALSFEL
jgi:hypothetical protein